VSEVTRPSDGRYDGVGPQLPETLEVSRYLGMYEQERVSTGRESAGRIIAHTITHQLCGHLRGQRGNVPCDLRAHFRRIEGTEHAATDEPAQDLQPGRSRDVRHQLIEGLTAHRLGKQDHGVEQRNAGDTFRFERRDLECNGAAQAVSAEHDPTQACGATRREHIVREINDAIPIHRHAALPTPTKVWGDDVISFCEVVEHRREMRPISEWRMDQNYRRLTSAALLVRDLNASRSCSLHSARSLPWIGPSNVRIIDF
jgi:hypothetical protein